MYICGGKPPFFLLMTQSTHAKKGKDKYTRIPKDPRRLRALAAPQVSMLLEAGH